jgi:XapX domain-containing protein
VIKIFSGLILGLLIGSACRWFDIPLPGPPKLVGALLIVSITLGYLGTDKLIARHFPARGSALTRELCGGPTGDLASDLKGIKPEMRRSQHS